VRMALLFLLMAGGDPSAMPPTAAPETPPQEPRNRRSTDAK
jgi:hypothetical protein